MTKISKQDFGDFVRKQRLQLIPPISLRGFAEKIGISATYLSKIERGDFDPPSENSIRLIARELKINEDELLGMAGKVSSDVATIIINKPVLTAQFLRASKGFTKEKWESLIIQAENLKKGED